MHGSMIINYGCVYVRRQCNLLPAVTETCIEQEAVLPLTSVAVAVTVEKPTFITALGWLWSKKIDAPDDE